jgi:hypothetical protein
MRGPGHAFEGLVIHVQAEYVMRRLDRAGARKDRRDIVSAKRDTPERRAARTHDRRFGSGRGGHRSQWQGSGTGKGAASGHLEAVSHGVVLWFVTGCRNGSVSLLPANTIPGGL